jgi:hypothetical protein
MVDESDTEPLQTGDVIEASQYGISEAMNEEGRGYPILRMGNYDSKGRMDYSELKHIEVSDDELDKYKLEKGMCCSIGLIVKSLLVKSPYTIVSYRMLFSHLILYGYT